MNNEKVSSYVESHRDELIELSKNIWENPELGWKEFKACKWTAELMEKNGFDVEVGAYGVPTAIRAAWGHGHPVIGFCGEFDALPGLSQKHSSKQDPIVPGAPGHGCGHNLLGSACAGAAIALKEFLQSENREGTVVFYGCPAEELLLGKAFMAKEGAFEECDIALAWHPGNGYVNTDGVLSGNNVAKFHFKGRTAHAAANPEQGRSGVDAVEIMNIGVQFLREHVTDDVRIHYTITDGGTAPNIVPDTGSVWYFVRALTREAVEDAYARVIRCAEGAAHMTDTKLEVEFLGGIYPTMPNKVLQNLLQDKLNEMEPPTYTEEELQFAAEVNAGHPNAADLPVDPSPLDRVVHPLGHFDGFASTDMGDVNHIVPSATVICTTAATRTIGHSWMMTACSGHSIGFKGMLYAAKVMAAAAADAVCDPTIIERAKEQFAKDMNGKKYVCPITDDVKNPF